MLNVAAVTHARGGAHGHLCFCGVMSYCPTAFLSPLACVGSGGLGLRDEVVI
jgi:hypothetical protein